MIGADTGATQISSGIVEFDAGSAIHLHYHDAEESMIVIEGEGIFVIGEEEHHVKLNDAAYINPGTHHRIINSGTGPFRVAWSYASVDWHTIPVEN